MNCVLSEIRTQSRKRGFPRTTNLVGTLILDSELLELRENKILLFKPPILWYFIMAAPGSFIHTYTYAYTTQEHMHSLLLQHVAHLTTSVITFPSPFG